MSKLRYNHSSAYIVKPDTPLSDCVKAMRDHGFGAVLVSDPSTRKPYGIFTERDVINWIEKIQDGGFWSRPVFLLMSKPLQTITLEEIPDAGRIMIEKGFRHLPVVHTDAETGETITSMISMRDILRNSVYWKNKERTFSENLPEALSVGMISGNKGMRNLLRSICAQHGNTSVETLEFKKAIPELAQDLRKLDLVFFDIDSTEPAQWSALLKELNSGKPHPEVIVIYDPFVHREFELQALEKLGLSGRFSVYMKPLNIYVLVNRLLMTRKNPSPT